MLKWTIAKATRRQLVQADMPAHPSNVSFRGKSGHRSAWPLCPYRGKGALVGRDADGIDRGVAAAAVALEVHPPGVIAVRSRQICCADKTRHDMTAAANHTLAGRACRNDDDATIPGQRSPIVDFLVAGNAGWACGLGRALVTECQAGDQWPNPPRLLEKFDHVLIFQAEVGTSTPSGYVGRNS